MRWSPMVPSPRVILWFCVWQDLSKETWTHESDNLKGFIEKYEKEIGRKHLEIKPPKVKEET